jgi:predicted DCC family thiol-disulfide oxidoreductase YuxK
MSQIIVIYDGDCNFCSVCIEWVQKRLIITALAFQDTDLAQFGLSIEQTQRAVYVIADGVEYRAAGAISFLLKARGNTFLAFMVKASGPLGEASYRWVASHRSSWLVGLLTKLLSK